MPSPIRTAFLRGLPFGCTCNSPMIVIRLIGIRRFGCSRSLAVRSHSDKISLVATPRVAGLGRDRSGADVAAMAEKTPKPTGGRQAQWIYTS